MPLSETQVLERIQGLHRHADPASPRYGRLLNWKGGGVWHYGIGLSDTHVFDTGQGMSAFDAPGHAIKHVLGVDGLHRPPHVVLARLTWALLAFRTWHYGLLGWNCEHLARLVATDEARSYEVGKRLVFGPQWHHRDAERLFHAFLQLHDPRLLRRAAATPA